MTLTPRAIKTIILVVIILLIAACYIFVPQKRKELILFLSSIFVTFLFLEMGVRILIPQVNDHNKLFQFDQELGWSFKPNQSALIVKKLEANHYVKTNSLGFRDKNKRIDPSQNNIMVIGDSFVSNLSVKAPFVFTEVMENRLENSNVLNFGVNGYGQIQELLLLRKWFDQIKPDMIIAMIYVRNDFQDNIGDHWGYPRPQAQWNAETNELEILPLSEYEPPKPEEKRKLPLRQYYKYSQLYQFIDFKIKYVRSKYFNDKRFDYTPTIITPPELYLCRREFSEETQQMYNMMEKSILSINNFAMEHKTPILFVIAPTIVQVEDKLWEDTVEAFELNMDEYDLAKPNKFLLDVARQNNIQMIDLLPTLKKQHEAGQKLYNTREQHWTIKGNEVVAQALVQYIQTTYP